MEPQDIIARLDDIIAKLDAARQDVALGIDAETLTGVLHEDANLIDHLISDIIEGLDASERW